MAENRRRFGFYRRLTAAQKREYDRSDALTSLPMAPHPALGEAANAVVAALATRKPAVVRHAAQLLAEVTNARLAQGLRRLPPAAPAIKVLRTRPRKAGAEFHGLYTLYADGRSEIRVWMLTAARGEVVRPRTFLRTLLHELCHHFDMAMLGLPSSLHTLGFHARESSLVRVLERSGARIPVGLRAAADRERAETPGPPPRARQRRAPEPASASPPPRPSRPRRPRPPDPPPAADVSPAADAPQDPSQPAPRARPPRRARRPGPPRQLDLFGR